MPDVESPIMTVRRHVLILAFVCMPLWLPSPGFSQEEAERQTREDWQAQVERARQKVEQIRREGTFVDQESEPPEETDKEIARRALRDDDLRAGDVVSTENGFVRFEGTTADEKRIFTPIAPPPNYRK